MKTNTSMNLSKKSKYRGRLTRVSTSILSITLSLGVLIPCDRSAAEEAAPKIPLFESMGMGTHHRKITTDSAEAQQFFDQGLIWMYAFNHDEAIRSFTRAAELDDDCAMAWWGVSLAAGPQYNHPVIDEERTATAWAAMQKAL